MVTHCVQVCLTALVPTSDTFIVHFPWLVRNGDSTQGRLVVDRHQGVLDTILVVPLINILTRATCAASHFKDNAVSLDNLSFSRLQDRSGALVTTTWVQHWDLRDS